MPRVSAEVGEVLAQHAAKPDRLATALVTQERKLRRRGRKAVLASRETGRDFHRSSRREQVQRAYILRAANMGIKLSAALKAAIGRRREPDAGD